MDSVRINTKEASAAGQPAAGSVDPMKRHQFLESTKVAGMTSNGEQTAERDGGVYRVELKEQLPAHATNAPPFESMQEMLDAMQKLDAHGRKMHTHDPVYRIWVESRIGATDFAQKGAGIEFGPVGVPRDGPAWEFGK